MNSRKPRPDLAERNRQNATHGLSKTSTFSIWRSMKQRCLNSKRKDFKNYGGRGITFCKRWESFELFLEDMGERPEGMSLERNDSNQNYEPSNCRWATPTEQARNRKSNVRYLWNGKEMCIAELSEISGIERKTLEYRLRIGWPLDKAMLQPSKRAA